MEIKAHIHTDQSAGSFKREFESAYDEDSVVLFNGVSSFFNDNAISLLAECVSKGIHVIVYWHESAWNLRYFMRKHTNYMESALALMSGFGEIDHWCTSLQQQQFVLLYLTVPFGRVRVVREALDISRFSMKSTAPAAGAQVRILGSGIPDLRKGVDRFIRLSDDLTHYKDKSISYTWYAARESKIRPDEMTRLGRVKWAGCVSNFDRVIAEYDVFMLPSRDDPFPLVVVEALAVGLPVFAFATTGWGEVLPGEFVITHEEEFAEKLESFLEISNEYPPQFFRKIASNYDTSKFVERIHLPLSHDQTYFPVTTPVSALQTLKSSLSNRIVYEDGLKARISRKVEAYNRSLKKVEELRESYSVNWKDGFHGLQKQYEELLEKNKALEEKFKDVTEEVKNLREAHKCARIEVKDHLVGKPSIQTLGRKKVLVIGNSPSVLNYELGSFIDSSFDHVVRINNFEINGYEKNVGQKVDYCVLSFACRENPILSELDPSQVLVYTASKYSEMDAVRERMLYGNKELRGCGVDPKKAVILSPTLYFHGLRFLVDLGAGKWPSTGVVAIQWAIDNFWRTHDVFYHGFSFYGESDELLRHYYKVDTPRDSHHDFEREKLYVLKLEAEGKIQDVVKDAPL
ncbi:MAG: glycosyltransferase family 29 protein [Opitutales bacterium]|nr:glycosyltransferase family 29 protein [Opitutales bacterium]